MTGTNYGPNEDITFIAGQYSAENGGLSLYANWIKSQGTMQNWTGCSNMSIGDVTALTDNRDGNTYAIAKLADGKCWMVENLRLADKSTTNPSSDATLTTINTNNPLNTDGTVALKNTDGTTADHLSPTTDPTSTAWCTSNSSACDDQSMLATNNTTLAGTTENSMTTPTNANVYSYGNYYNWYSATAGKGTYSKSGGNTDGDLCPAGWHLPTGKDASGDFGVLDVALGGTGAYQSGDAGTTMSKKWRSWPNNFIYSGDVRGSSVSSRGSVGYYWSSTVGNSNYAYILYFNSSRVYPGTYSNFKYYGSLVRCVAQ